MIVGCRFGFELPAELADEHAQHLHVVRVSGPQTRSRSHRWVSSFPGCSESASSEAHSVLVRRTSSPARVTRCPSQVDRESVEREEHRPVAAPAARPAAGARGPAPSARRSRTASSGSRRRRGPARRPCRLVLADRQHEDWHGARRRSSRQTARPSIPGRFRSRTTRSGANAAAIGERVARRRPPAPRGSRGRSSARPTARGSAPRRRRRGPLLLHARRATPRERDRERRSAARRLLDPDLPVHHLEESLAIASPRPVPRRGCRSVSLVEGIEELLAGRRGHAAPWSITRTATRRRRGDASTSIVVLPLLGRCLRRVVQQVRTTRSRNTGSARTSVGASSIADVDRSAGHWRRTRSTAAASDLGRDRPPGAAACSIPPSIRDMSSRFAMRALSRSVSMSMRLERLALAARRPASASSVEQVRHRCLDRGQRAAEVVRDRRQQRPPDLVRLPEDLRLGGGAQEPVALEHERELVAERSQDPALRRA